MRLTDYEARVAREVRRLSDAIHVACVLGSVDQLDSVTHEEEVRAVGRMSNAVLSAIDDGRLLVRIRAEEEPMWVVATVGERESVRVLRRLLAETTS